VAGGVLIVGASLGGLRLAEQLRASDYGGPITIVGAERHMPYNRPPLSKDVLLDEAAGGHANDPHPGRLAFGIRPSLADVTWLLGQPAVSADLTQQAVTLADGRRLNYHALGIATGLTPRRLPFKGGDANRHVVRTIDDAIRLRQVLIPGARVVVAGGGFVGCEVAASAVKRGCSVTIVEPLTAPMCRSIGQELAFAIQAYHEANGVQFRLGRTITGLACDRRDSGLLLAVKLDDGTERPADVLIEAIGSTCNVDWLQGNGLDLADGVVTDHAMRAGERANVVAVGDVARFPNSRYGSVPRRVEHWAIPGLTAKQAASSLAAVLAGRDAGGSTFNPVPTFWSDQFGIRLQSMGMPSLADRTELMEGSLSSIGQANGPGLAMGYWCGDALAGVVTIGLPVARLSHYRAMLN
jgi:3-phenylpropionate/trans-cinnamate dioxygenase ferredoxin reductase component